MLQRFREFSFLFQELAKRDFKKKYKRTVLGMLWSVLSPLLSLLVMRMVFTHFFGSAIPHYTTYLFAGNIVYSYFTEATNGGMSALVANKDIFSKVNLPKYLFVFSSNVSSFINFALTLAVFFLFAALDGVTFTWLFFMILFSILCQLVFNVGMSLILSAAELFFRDTAYLYRVFTLLLMYLSAIFYDVATFPASVQRLFLINPIYVYIKFIRLIVIEGTLPSPEYFLLCVLYAGVALSLGLWIYKKYNNRFLYYV